MADNTQTHRTNRVFKSLHKPLTYLGVERTLFYFVCVGAVGAFNLFNSIDQRDIMRDALRRGMGDLTFSQVRDNFEHRRAIGEFQTVEAQKHDTGPRLTTPETIAAERATVAQLGDAVSPHLLVRNLLLSAQT